MSETRAAYRYAEALIGVAEELKQLDPVGADFERLALLLAGSAEFRLFIKSPVIRTEKKKAVITELFRGRTSDVTYHFLRLLVAKSRERILPEIIGQFQRLWDERRGILNGEVRSAVRLDPAQERSVIDHLERVTKKKIRLDAAVDPSLIGGLTIRFGDTVWDGSVRRQLESLRRRLAEGNA